MFGDQDEVLMSWCFEWTYLRAVAVQILFHLTLKIFSNHPKIRCQDSGLISRNSEKI
jgi:hypothetical protein